MHRFWAVPQLVEQRRIGEHQSARYHSVIVSSLRPLDGSTSLGTTCTALAFCPDNANLVVGDENARLQIWHPDYGRGAIAKSFDTGHTGSIQCVRFLAGSSGAKLISCSTDRQVRLIDLQRQATRSFLCHRARVRALAGVTPDVFLSASEDGTVRLFDIRQANRGVTAGAPRGAAASPAGGVTGSDTPLLLVEQRCERPGRSASALQRISINTLAVSPLAPHLFVTGGGDPFARMYDMRMLRGASSRADQSPAGGSSAWRPPWVSCFAPHRMCSPALAAGSVGGFNTLGRARHLTGLAFAAGGQHLLLSYSGDAIYAVDCREHAMSVEELEERLRRRAAGSVRSTAAPLTPPLQRGTTGAQTATGVAAAAARGAASASRAELGRTGVGGGVGAAAGASEPRPGQAAAAAGGRQAVVAGQTQHGSGEALRLRAARPLGILQAALSASGLTQVAPPPAELQPPGGAVGPESGRIRLRLRRTLRDAGQDAPQLHAGRGAGPPPPPAEAAMQPTEGRVAAVSEGPEGERTLLALQLPAGVMTISAGTASLPTAEGQAGPGQALGDASGAVPAMTLVRAAAAGRPGAADAAGQTSSPAGSPTQSARRVAVYRYTLSPSGGPRPPIPGGPSLDPQPAATAAASGSRAASTLQLDGAAQPVLPAATAAAGGRGRGEACPGEDTEMLDAPDTTAVAAAGPAAASTSSAAPDPLRRLRPGRRTRGAEAEGTQVQRPAGANPEVVMEDGVGGTSTGTSNGLAAARAGPPSALDGGGRGVCGGSDAAVSPHGSPRDPQGPSGSQGGRPQQEQQHQQQMPPGGHPSKRRRTLDSRPGHDSHASGCQAERSSSAADYTTTRDRQSTPGPPEAEEQRQGPAAAGPVPGLAAVEAGSAAGLGSAATGSPGSGVGEQRPQVPVPVRLAAATTAAEDPPAVQVGAGALTLQVGSGGGDGGGGADLRAVRGGHELLPSTFELLPPLLSSSSSDDDDRMLPPLRPLLASSAPFDEVRERPQVAGRTRQRVGAVVAAAAEGPARGLEVEEGEAGGGYLRCFDGHKNVMTNKEVAWLGGSGCGPSYVVSGSDDGHVFVWEYGTGDIVRMMPLKEQVIPTCLAVHPTEPMIASCGMGSVVRVWAPGGSATTAAAATATRPRSAPATAAAAANVDAGAYRDRGRSPGEPVPSDAEAAGREAGAEEEDDGGMPEGRAFSAGGGTRRTAQARRLLDPLRQAVVEANRADLRRRRAEAEAEATAAAAAGSAAAAGGTGRPVGAGWATFAAAIRDRASPGDQRAVGPTLDPAAAGAAGAAARAQSPWNRLLQRQLATVGLGRRSRELPEQQPWLAQPGAATTPSPHRRQRTDQERRASGVPGLGRRGAGESEGGGEAGEEEDRREEEEEEEEEEQERTPRGRVLRLSTALERQARRSGSPEETIPAFGMTPPAGEEGSRRGFGRRGALGMDDEDGEDAAEEGGANQYTVSPQGCTVM